MPFEFAIHRAGTISTKLLKRPYAVVETLVALRAYDTGDSIRNALESWYEQAEKVLPATREYLLEHRHDDQYDESLLQDIERAFREDFEYGRELQASFGDNLRSKLVKLLREDTPTAPVPFEEYDELLSTAVDVFEGFPHAKTVLNEPYVVSDYDRVWAIVRDYATWIGDDDLLQGIKTPFEVVRGRNVTVQSVESTVSRFASSGERSESETRVPQHTTLLR